MYNKRITKEANGYLTANGYSNGYKYSGSSNADAVAWHKRNASDKSHPVGSKTANEPGIYDMSGNVWEWCAEQKGAYSATALTNPKGATSGTKHILRGGCGAATKIVAVCRIATMASPLIATTLSASASPDNHLGAPNSFAPFVILFKFRK